MNENIIPIEVDEQIKQDLPKAEPDTPPKSIPVEKPTGMTDEASKMFDMMSAVKSEPKLQESQPTTARTFRGINLNKLENKLQCKMNKIIKRRRRKAKAKLSRRRNRKK